MPAARRTRFPLLAFAALLLAGLQLAPIRPALACACCSERGTRVDRSVALDDPTRTQLERMTFGKEAALTTGMDDAPTGLPRGMGSELALAVTRTGDAMTFAFRAHNGMNGALRFAMPKQMWLFTVDTYGDARDEGLGPPLYTEWRLTADATGDGVFSRATAGRKATLIFHGRGRGCTEAEDFTDWSLVLHGTGATITFYGRLETP